VEDLVSVGAKRPQADETFRLPPDAHAKIVALHEYWQRAAPGPDRLPGRQHIDPVDIPKLLANMWMLDVVDETADGQSRRFRFRIIGTALQRIGLTARVGDYVDQFIDEKVRATALEEIHRVVTTRSPVWFRGKAFMRHDSKAFTLERLLTPLASNGAKVDTILCLTVFYTPGGDPI
jgi:hypothetical protein